VNKFNGFNGDSLHTQLHYEINFGGKGIRNLCPAKGGSHLYGSDIYFLSDRNLAESNDSFFLVHITDTINAPSQQLTTQTIISPVTYFVPINGLQFSGGDLATNDARVLGAFYENDKIQFAGNTTDTFSATSAFYHGIISNVSTTPTIDLHIISHPELSYGYPDLSYAGKNSGDNTAIINLLRSGVNLNGGNASIVSDGNGNYSAVSNVKFGDSYSSQIFGTERWGDYTGSQYDYNEPGKVWVNGSYFNVNHKTTSWISQLSLTPPPASVQGISSGAQTVNMYPNPADDLVMIEFELATYTDCTFNLYDAQGKLVKTLMNERVKPGVNHFSFSSKPLAKGIYFLSVISNGKIIESKHLVKE
ncbi:MAG: T9SS type A sorting domain-containing protein, partial [Chitinophagales bacterium]|nr:T9SS type A sorting domain-containing protein [Chitinophagales bacterium]